MARIRSPGYPNASLQQIIEYASKIHAADRQHPVDRETAAKHMGFSGLSGASDRALSALLHFGLSEKVRKGELRVSDLALRILHPADPQERREALREAAFSPELFQELRARYPDSPPSRETLTSFLSREGFASAAISPAARAYLDTCSFLQQEHAYDFDVALRDPAPESTPTAADMETHMDSTDTLERPTDASAPTPNAPPSRQQRDSRELSLNEPHLDIKGTREVRIEGIFDHAGLVELEGKLAALKMLLKPKVASDKDNE